MLPFKTYIMDCCRSVMSKITDRERVENDHSSPIKQSSPSTETIGRTRSKREKCDDGVQLFEDISSSRKEYDQENIENHTHWTADHRSDGMIRNQPYDSKNILSPIGHRDGKSMASLTTLPPPVPNTTARRGMSCVLG